jgi:type I restriction enzyme S subunit
MNRNCRPTRSAPWFDKAPAHWDQPRLKDVIQDCAAGVWGNEPIGDGSDTHVVRVADFDRIGRVVSDAPTLRSITNDQRDSRLLEPGDLLLEKSGDVGTVVEFRGEAGAVCSNFLMRMRPRHGTDGRFLRYVHEYLYSSNVPQIHSQKITIANLDTDRYLSEHFPTPRIEEQRAIAAHLDAETARIDALIRDKQRLVGLILELRESTIRQLTTGIKRSASLWNTSDPFLPKLPKDWNLVRLGRIARIGNGSTPSRQNESFWSGGTFPWLNSAVVNEDDVLEGSEFVTEAALAACHLPRLRPGVVLMAMIGQGRTRGKVAVLRIEATLSQNIAYIDPEGDAMDSDFLFWFLAGAYRQVRLLSDGRGGNQAALSCDEIARLSIPLPPLSVQREIAMDLRGTCSKVSDLFRHVQQEVTLLQELRASTVADAVLGRIDALR